MPIRLKNLETERLAREQAGRPSAEEIEAIVERYWRLPVLSNVPEDEVLGYDEFGIPGRAAKW